MKEEITKRIKKKEVIIVKIKNKKAVNAIKVLHEQNDINIQDLITYLLLVGI